MRNLWSGVEASRAVERWGSRWGEAVALRTYSSRLIGQEPGLVLHGGGNTSVKDVAVDLLGVEREALFVKGSGWDLAALEPQGLPSVDLSWLRQLRVIEEMTDDEMVNTIRTHLFDASAPNPSIETLLHAFLPHRFVDHSHADAILALTNTVRGEEPVREALGDDLALVPYVMPGFELSRLAASVYEAHPDCIGLVLLKHGLFTFGDTAEESYARHIEVVSRAEAYLERVAQRVVVPTPSRVDSVAAAQARAERLAPRLRGALADRTNGGCGRFVLDWRGGPEVLANVGDARWAEAVQTGPLTPDHVIRTKALPLVLELDLEADPSAWDAPIEAAVRTYGETYEQYFDRCATAAEGRQAYTRLDPIPRVVVVPGVGLFGVGASPRDARIAADIYERTLAAKYSSSAVGTWEGLTEQQLFEMEYWGLEQAKLGNRTEAALARRVALVTGGAGAIGVGIARELLDAGACVALVDIDEAGLQVAVEALGGEREQLLVCTADVTSPDDLGRAVDTVSLRWGGVDLVVANAGIAGTGRIDQMALEDFKAVLDVNLTGTWNTLHRGAQALIAQGTGGGIVIVSSKNVLAPGAEFGAYSASKAGAHQLGRIAALELAEHGIRVNLITPDAVFAEGEVRSGLWDHVGPERARSRGMDVADLPAYYRDRNLLHAEVTGRHVGRAVVFFASEQTPTTGAVLPVDGGLPGAFPR